jgi:hypothetical protein
MNFSRAFLALGAVLAVLTGVLYLVPGAASRLGLDFWKLPDLGVQLQRDEAYGTELDREAEEALRRVAAKEETVRGVVEGRLTLGQAAARFRALDAGAPPSTRQVLAERFPAVPEDERCCREVIAWVAADEEKRPDGGPGLARRLAAELDDAVRHGGLSLPDQPLLAYPDQEHTPP